MSAHGRCDGCQENGPLRDMEAHVLGCAKWAAAYRADPSSVLDPGPAYERWDAEDRPAEKQADLQRRMADTAGRRRRMADRFAGEDILA